ncbi:MAG: quinone oxidoreductase [Rhodobiaceae bacterium]|nr:quinone oxidoreductase [Rhodobiaceae bacterium]|tara:strand:- start:90971 stop:91942 length:972 start_codon:yes stop_codon:yes gene_type:complete
MRKIILNETGDAEQMELTEVEIPSASTDQVLVKHAAIGINFIDIYQRSGLYPLNLPSGLGLEASGVVESVGELVKNFKVGDRVCYCNGPVGAYAEFNLVPESLLVHLPNEIDFDVIAGGFLKGLTAYFLLHDVYEVAKGQKILFHAAAGGVGSIATSWAKSMGALVIGTVGSEKKLDYAKSNGCDFVINYNTTSFKDKVDEITNSEGVTVVYDSIGKNTIEDSMDVLEKRGLLVSFGNASGVPEPINILDLMKKGSIYVTRPTLFDYVKTRDQLEKASSSFFDALINKKVSIDIQQEFSLENIADAHNSLTRRETMGATIIKP